MNILERGRAILVSPKTEWEQIKDEEAGASGLLRGYAAIAAAIPAVATLLGLLLFFSSVRYGVTPIQSIIVYALVTYAVFVATPYLMSLAMPRLAPPFDCESDADLAAKLIFFSATPLWLGGALYVLGGSIGLIGVIAGFAYASYLFYLGCQSLLGTAEDKAMGLTIVLMLAWFIVHFLLLTLIAQILLGRVRAGAFFLY